MKIAHISDIHFGRIIGPDVVEELISDVKSSEVDLTIISGDLTQRATHRQFKKSVALLQRLDPPHLVVPGNHDVYPWWFPFSRIFRPLARFKKYHGPDMVRVFETEDIAVLGVNSAHGLTIKGGKITREIARSIDTFFAARDGAFKILVLHHHLAHIAPLMPHDVIRDAAYHMKAAYEAGVHLILCGHIHISHVESLDNMGDRPVIVASAGTATSNRGRRSNRKKNYYNLIEISDAEVTIQERMYEREMNAFHTDRQTRFKRPQR